MAEKCWWLSYVVSFQCITSTPMRHNIEYEGTVCAIFIKRQKYQIHCCVKTNLVQCTSFIVPNGKKFYNNHVHAMNFVSNFPTGNLKLSIFSCLKTLARLSNSTLILIKCYMWIIFKAQHIMILHFWTTTKFSQFCLLTQQK